jgi:hypothetical protein
MLLCYASIYSIELDRALSEEDVTKFENNMRNETSVTYIRLTERIHLTAYNAKSPKL